MNPSKGGYDADCSSERSTPRSLSNAEAMSSAQVSEQLHTEQVRASIEAWLEVAEPILSDLEAASTLTQRDLAVRVNSK